MTIPNRDQLGKMTGGDLRLVRFLEELAANADLAEVQADVATLQTDLDALETTVAGLSGLAASFETVNKNLVASDATLAYSGGNLATVTYANGIVKTFAYSGSNLTTVTLSGSTPGGIDLVKSFVYTGSDLTGVSYS